jgi:hypothetical protein
LPWTNNASEQALKSPKHQKVSGYWHTLTTLARFCTVRSYLTSVCNHGHRHRRHPQRPHRQPLDATPHRLTTKINSRQPREWTLAWAVVLSEKVTVNKAWTVSLAKVPANAALTVDRSENPR